MFDSDLGGNIGKALMNIVPTQSAYTHLWLKVTCFHRLNCYHSCTCEHNFSFHRKWSVFCPETPFYLKIMRRTHLTLTCWVVVSIWWCKKETQASTELHSITWMRKNMINSTSSDLMLVYIRRANESHNFAIVYESNHRPMNRVRLVYSTVTMKSL